MYNVTEHLNQERCCACQSFQTLLNYNTTILCIYAFRGRRFLWFPSFCVCAHMVSLLERKT